MAKPFTTPSTSAEVHSQLRNLEHGLKAFHNHPQLSDTATLDDVRSKLNSILAALQQMTVAGNVEKRR